MIDPVQALVHGPLGRAGGVAVFDGVPDPGTCTALAYEAHASYPESTRQALEDGDGADGRGGMPARALQTAARAPSRTRSTRHPGCTRSSATSAASRSARAGTAAATATTSSPEITSACTSTSTRATSR